MGYDVGYLSVFSFPSDMKVARSRLQLPCVRPPVLHAGTQHAIRSFTAVCSEVNLEWACDRHAVRWQKRAGGLCQCSLMLRGGRRGAGVAWQAGLGLSGFWWACAGP